MESLTNNQIKVVRRNGSYADLDVSRIREVIDWSCDKLKVNPVELESHVTTRLRNGITTREIQENIINSALSLCNVNAPDWRYVAGRLHMWGLRKDIKASRGYDYDNDRFVEYVKRQVQLGRYEEKILDAYSDYDLKHVAQFINKNLDKDYDYAGAVMLTDRYLVDDELPQEAYMVISLLLASNEHPDDRLIYAKNFYQAVSERKISLATPILTNLRRPNGSLSSCFILATDDNIESIFAAITDAARISKNGGGVGINLSRIRATGSWVMQNENAAKGVVSWVKIFNDVAIAVDQGGKRSGAFTVGIDVWHLDIPEFIEMQTESGSDLRRKCFDVFPQVVIPDEFMRRVKDPIKYGEHWYLVDPYEIRTRLGVELAEMWGEAFELEYKRVEESIENGEIELFQKVNARDLFKQIMRVQLETGLPYLIFKDTINRANPNKHLGYIPQTNLCVESFSNVSPDDETHCCNLVSLNLANLDYWELEKHCDIAVRILDNTIDLTKTPTKSSQKHNDVYRTIGVGVMGFADYLAQRKLKYQDVKFIDNIFECLSYFCTKASVSLAKERGAYPAFYGSEWSRGKLMNSRDINWIKENAWEPTRFEKLIEDINKYGIRNSHIMAIAPNTSSSLLQGCTASVLPVYSRFFQDKWTKGNVPICPPYINEAYWDYQENKLLDQNVLVNVISHVQKWVDTGISMELLFNLNEDIYRDGFITAKDIFDTLVLSWELGCKAVYYVRTIQKDDYTELLKNECSSCAN